MRGRYNGLHMFEQGRGESVAECAENGVVRQGVPIDLVGRAQEVVRLSNGDATEREPTAAMLR